MKNPVKILAFACVLCTSAYGVVCNADDCEDPNTELTIAGLIKENSGSKVLKVEEALDEQGCIELRVRILINGTVKAITIPNGTGA